MAKKKVLITGVTGMVGSHLLDYLFENSNHEIHGLCRWRSPLDNIRSHIPRINKKDRVFLHYGDLRDEQSIRAVFREVKPNFVYHLGAQSFPKTSFTSVTDTFDTNIQGTYRVLEAIKIYCPEALVHVCASSEVFGKVDKTQVPISEDCAFHPASPYAISKVGTDLIGRYYAEAYGLKVMTTRMFTHTGPRRGDVFAESTFAKQIALIEAGFIDPIVKVGNLESLRTIADVRDAVRAYHLLLTVNPKGGEYYNIGGEHSCTIGDILNDLLSLSSQQDIKIIVDKERLRPIDADLQIPDTKKFREHTGWKPQISYEKTMSDLLDYWRAEVTERGQAFLSR